MSDNLDDGEFWLPSQFLTDDDILNDFSPNKKDGLGSGSDLDSLSGGSVTGSTETESDEDELLTGLTHQMARSTVEDCAKGSVLSSSPQSTLCGFVGKEGSSRGSPNGPVSPPPVATKNDGGAATWDLLYKAADEVARMKMRSEAITTTAAAATGASVGTGFFDCSSKGLLCPPPTRTTTSNNNNYPASFYSQPQFQPLSHLQLQLRQQQQQQMMKQQSNGGPQFNRLTRNNCNTTSRPLGLPPSAWPPLQGQTQAQAQHIPPMFMGQPGPGPKRESVGTGVFLPRRVTPTNDSRKKPEGNATKMRSGKGLQSQQKRSSRPPTTANQCEIQLPQEWTY